MNMEKNTNVMNKNENRMVNKPDATVDSLSMVSKRSNSIFSSVYSFKEFIMSEKLVSRSCIHNPSCRHYSLNSRYT